MVDGRPAIPAVPAHRVRRWAAFVGVGLVFTLVLVLASLHTPPAHRYVLSRIQSWAAGQNVDLTISKLDYNLLTRSVTLRDVTVRRRDTPDLPPFAQAERVTIRASLPPLLLGRYVIEWGEIIRPTLQLVIDEHDRDNVPRPPEKREEPERPVEYMIRSLTVREGRVAFDDRRQQLDFHMPLHEISIKGVGMRRHVVRFSATDGHLTLQGRHVTIDQADAEVSLEPDRIGLRQFDVASGEAKISASATLTQLNDPRYDVSLAATLDAARIATFVGFSEPIMGSVRARVSARGPLASMVVESHIDGQSLSFRNAKDLELAADLSYEAAARRAKVDRLTIRGPAGRLEADGAVALDARGGTSHLRARLADIDGEILSHTLRLPCVLATRASGSIDAQWPRLDAALATGEAHLSLVATRGGKPHGVIPLTGHLAATSRAGTTELDISSLSSLGVTIAGGMSLVNRHEVHGHITARGDDVGPVLTAIGAVFAHKDFLPTRISGSAFADLRLAGTLDAPTARIDLRAPELTLGQTSGVSATMAADYINSGLTIDHADLTWNAARLSASGRIGIGAMQELALDLAGENVDVPALLAIVNHADIPASGTVSFEGHLSGTATHPMGNFSLQATDLQAYGETFGNLSADAALMNRRVELKQLVLHKPQSGEEGRLTASGSYDLERGNYELSANGANLRLTSMTLPGGRIVRGAITLAGTASGAGKTPNGSLRMTVAGLRVGDRDLGTMVLDATAANREVRLTGTAEKFQLAVDGRVGAREPYPASLELRTSGLDLAALTNSQGSTLTGRVTARVTATGDLRHLRAASASATIDKVSAAWNGEPFETEGPVTASYRDELITIDRMTLRARGSTATVSGSLPLDSRAQDVALQIEGNLDLASLARYVPVQRNVTGAGNLKVSGTIRGSLKAIEPDLVIDTENAAISAAGFEPGLSDVRARLGISAGRLRIEQFGAGWGTARLNISGEIPLGIVPSSLPLVKAEGPAKLQIDLAKLDVSTLPGAPDGLGGLVSFRAQAEATRADLGAVTGRVSFSDLGVRFKNVTLDQESESTISIAGGIANVERFQLAGSIGKLSVAGQVALAGERKLDVAAQGEIDAAAVSSFLSQMAVQGTTTFQLSARGPIFEPQIAGFLEVKDGDFRTDAPRIAARDVNLRLDLTADRATLTRLSGTLNGGTLTGSGSVALGGPDRIKNVDLRIGGEDVALDDPFDIRTISDADIRITTREGRFVVGGTVTIKEGGLTRDIDLDSNLFAAMTAPRVLDLTQERNRLLERVALDVNVATASPIVVDNNLGRAELTGNVRVIGTPYQTGLSGRVSIEEGSELTLNDRRYEVERGHVTFVEERRVVPSMDLAFSTTARDYDISISVTGTPGHTVTTLTSDPVLPEPEIMALLMTGRTLEEMRGAEFEVAKTQALSYLGGRIGTSFGRRVEKATGLSTVQVEPSLVAGETNPSARLTLGEDVTKNLKLIYSTDLRNSSDQLWIAQYDVSRRFVSRAVRQSDGSYRLDFRHDLKLGGNRAQRHMPHRLRQIVAAIEVDGNTGFTMDQIRKRFGIKPGNTYDFFATRRGLDRVTEMYMARGWLEARIRLERRSDGRSVTLALHIVPGPNVELIVDGIEPPDKLRKELNLTWNQGAYDEQRISDVESSLTSWLVDDHHYAPTFEHAVEAVAAGGKRVVIRVEPGARFDQASVEFPGAQEITSDTLKKIIADQKLQSKVFTAPAQVTDLLTRFYREQGFLRAAMDAPKYDFSSETATARVIMAVHEGPRFTVRRMSVDGNRALSTEALVSDIPLVAGNPFLPAVADRSLARVRDLYWQQGYSDVDLDYQLALDPPAGAVDVRLVVNEGRRSVVTDVEVTGTDETSKRLVLGELELRRGEALDLQSLGSSRQNLYRTGAFSLVDITREEIDPPGAAPGAEKPERVTVNVQEVPPFQIRYGALYDTERGVGGILDFSNHNSLGKARVLGLRARYDSQLKEGRLYFNQPALRRLPLETLVALYRAQERHPSIGGVTQYNIDRTGLSIQQEKHTGNDYVWSYGFRFEHARTSSPTPDPVLNTDIRVAPLTSTLTRDTRDEALDASRGSLLSHAFEFSPRQLGSTVTFVKYFGQYVTYIPLKKPEQRPFTGEILRPRLVFATGVRLGLSHAFGPAGAVPLSEHFLAGGSTSVRGFPQDGLGPKGLGGEPLGGAAMFILNNELRFPVHGPLDGVVFLDAGNVFPSIKDFSFSDLREAAGFGLRVHVRSILVRLDLGFPLDRREGDDASRLFFSIGQAF